MRRTGEVARIDESDLIAGKLKIEKLIRNLLHQTSC